MRRLITVIAAATVLGCSSAGLLYRDLNQLNRDVNTSAAEAMGTYTAPTLAASPRPSGCSDARCRQLDDLEVKLYAAARSKQISYGSLVDRFYESRARLYPDSNEQSWVYELRSFQRVLAEHVDAGKVSGAEWEYLVERKSSEISERRRTRRTVCNTSNVGSREFPEYKTICKQ